MAAMRAMKAEGGWAVICTEETEIDPTTDMSPLIEGRLWEKGDIPVYAAIISHSTWYKISVRPGSSKRLLEIT